MKSLSFMRNNGENVIGALRLNLGFESGLEADFVRMRADDIADRSVVPVIERVLEDYSDACISDIDSIELDLGTVTEDELPYALERQLRDRLDRMAGSGSAEFFSGEGVSAGELFSSDDFGTVDMKSEPAWDGLVSYLSGPSVPWNSGPEFNPSDMLSAASEVMDSRLAELDDMQLARLEVLVKETLSSDSGNEVIGGEVVSHGQIRPGLEGVLDRIVEIRSYRHIGVSSAQRTALWNKYFRQGARHSGPDPESSEMPDRVGNDGEMLNQVQHDGNWNYRDGIGSGNVEIGDDGLKSGNGRGEKDESEGEVEGSGRGEKNESEGDGIDRGIEGNGRGAGWKRIDGGMEVNGMNGDGYGKDERIEWNGKDIWGDGSGAVWKMEKGGRIGWGDENEEGGDGQKNGNGVDGNERYGEGDGSGSNEGVGQREGAVDDALNESDDRLKMKVSGVARHSGLDPESSEMPDQVRHDMGQSRHDWEGDAVIIAGLARNLPPDDPSIWEPSEEESAEIPGRLFIPDAGLVLIHPFIRHLFRNMELVDEKGEFVSWPARMHAVHLLRHVTGHGGVHFDHCLTLEKILCGLPAGYVVPLQWKSGPKDEEETESLLRAVLSYWRTLSKSSPGALQKGFLQRAGSVEEDEGTYIVRVEQSAMDILMDDLPWEMSVIMLPWLKQPVIVEWQR